MPIEVPFEKPVLTRSVIYFPLVGGAVGLCLGIAAWLLSMMLPPWPAAVISLTVWVALSGGLHLDGWMDTADGVLSHRSREKMLDIMKDSRVGAMGVLAAVLLLLLKASLLAELMKGDIQVGLPLLFILIICSSWSRAWMAVAIAGWPSARPEGGIGSLFNGVKGMWAGYSVSLAALITFISLIINEINYLESLMLVVSCFIVVMIVGGGMAFWLNRKLGGLTGDTYGAMNEAVEAALLLAAVAWAQMLS